jgi:hypothetical protein
VLRLFLRLHAIKKRGVRYVIQINTEPLVFIAEGMALEMMGRYQGGG